MSFFRELLSLHGYPTEPLFGRRYGQAYGNRVATARALGERQEARPHPAPAPGAVPPAECSPCCA